MLIHYNFNTLWYDWTTDSFIAINNVIITITILSLSTSLCVFYFLMEITYFHIIIYIFLIRDKIRRCKRKGEKYTVGGLYFLYMHFSSPVILLFCITKFAIWFSFILAFITRKDASFLWSHASHLVYWRDLSY